MATTKTLTPTNQAITLAAFTEKPDNRTNVTNDDKLADAVNALNSNINSLSDGVGIDTISIESGSFVTLATFTPPTNGSYLIEFDAAFGTGDGIRILVVDTNEASSNGVYNSVLANGRSTLQKIRVCGLTTSDTVYMRVYQNSGSPMNVNGYYRVLKLK